MRFAPSAWKAERLSVFQTERAKQFVNSHWLFINAMHCSHGTLAERFATEDFVLRSLGLESRATIGFPNRASEAICEP